MLKITRLPNVSAFYTKLIYTLESWLYKSVYVHVTAGRVQAKPQCTPTGQYARLYICLLSYAAERSFFVVLLKLNVSIKKRLSKKEEVLISRCLNFFCNAL